jgi:hypothetical protein
VSVAVCARWVQWAAASGSVPAHLSSALNVASHGVLGQLFIDCGGSGLTRQLMVMVCLDNSGVSSFTTAVPFCLQAVADCGVAGGC